MLQKVMRRSQHARKETEFLRLKRTRLGLDDFESLKVIGRGAFGEVRLRFTQRILCSLLCSICRPLVPAEVFSFRFAWCRKKTPDTYTP